ncbi:MAG: ABC transporter permease [Chloroflexota bacterium]|nr:ABC transporter permease [Chloroflexota bacterium]
MQTLALAPTVRDAAGRTAGFGPRLRRFWHQRVTPSLVLGAGLLLVVAGLTIFAPLIAWYGPNQTLPGMALQPPTAMNPFGTDAIGRDVFSRVLHGGRVSFSVAIPAVALATVIGVSLGLVAGYFGGKVDLVIMRLLDVLFAFPAILLAITIVTILGPSVRNLVITIGIIYLPRMARIARAPTLSIREREFVEAARSIGVSDFSILWRHILPNIASPVLVEVSLALGQVLLTETALSFLGLGPPPPDPSWGAMVSEGRAFMQLAPWTVLAPGAAIVVATGAFLLIGSGLRSALNPRDH